MRAYQRSARILEEVDPSCQVPWTLLAAIGRVESDHGRYAGATIGQDGVSSPLILGVPLNGNGPVSRVADTDDGRLDQDSRWDRAVGPMQFIPTTWAAAGVDGDSDGVRSPNDIDDAALASAVYLCAATEGVHGPGSMHAALLRYNNSDSYVSLVMAYERSYRAGAMTVSDKPVSRLVDLAKLDATLETEVTRAVGAVVKHDKATEDASQGKAKKQPRTPDTDGGSKPATAKRDDSSPHGAASAPKPKPLSADDADNPKADTPKADTPKAGDPKAENPKADDPKADDPRADDPTPDHQPDSSPTPVPVPDPGPSPDPEPVPDPAPSPDPEPVPDPVLFLAEGVWTACDEAFCLDDQVLDLGLVELLENPAAADFDADETLETNAEEFAGLEGLTVTLTIEQLATGWRVHAINDYAYLLEDGTPALTTESAPLLD